jgi:predicted glycosyltransferase
MPNINKSALFCINTPAQAYVWRHVIKNLVQSGYEVRVLAREYGSTLEILSEMGVPVCRFRTFSKRYLRFFSLFVHVYHGLRICRGFDPGVVVGFGCDAAIISAFLRSPCIVFTDTETTPVQHLLTRLFAKVIITPGCFSKDLGKKHLRIESFKELAYLHPAYFKPDPTIISELKLRPDDKYVILRFNVFDAVHDIGKYGFSKGDQSRLVQELSKHARVFISPEGALSADLEQYRLPIANSRIHHVLYYSQLLVTDTQTMTTEAAILGTPAVRCNSFLGNRDMANFIELEKKYDLIYSIRETDRAIRKALELVQRPGLKEQWAVKRQKLIEDKLDLVRFLTEFTSGFPESFDAFKEGVNF